MVEAGRDDVSMNSLNNNINEDTMMADSSIEVVVKPRNNFSNSALRRVVPQIDLKKKKESLTMSMINISSGGGSRLFVSNSNNNGGEEGRHLSFNLIEKQISFSSPKGRDIVHAVRDNSDKIQSHAKIEEHNSEDESSEKSDATSESDGSDTSSIDAAFNGEEETED